MPYTLADMARVEADPLKAAVIDVLRRESFMMEYLTWDTIDGLSTQILRTKSLPTVAFRKIGTAFADSKGQIEPISERVFDIGGMIDIDKVLVKAKTIVDQRALQSDMYVTAISYAFNDYCINGDPTVDEDGLTGLWYRSLNYWPAEQHINLAGLDISADAGAPLAANEDTFLDGLQSAIHALDGHKADLIVANDTLYLRLLSVIRKKGLFATVEDSYGRTVATFGPGGPKIVDLGVKADQTTRIIGNVENSIGTLLTTGGSTSVYVMRLGMEKYLQGIQLYDVDVQDIGLLESGVGFRTVVDWPVGLMHIHGKACSRLSGINAA